MGRESCRIIKNKFSTAPLCKEPSREKNAPITRNLCAVSNCAEKGSGRNFWKPPVIAQSLILQKQFSFIQATAIKKGARDSLTVSLAPKNENINQP